MPDEDEDEDEFKGKQGCNCCLFKATSLAMLNKQMLSFFLATYDTFSLVIAKPSFIWFGPTSVDICTVEWLEKVPLYKKKRGHLFLAGKKQSIY